MGTVTIQDEIKKAVQAACDDAWELGQSVHERIYRRSLHRDVPGGDIVIETRESRDENKSRNGGDYFFYTIITPVEDGFYIYPDWSAEFDRIASLGQGTRFVTDAYSLDDLEAMASVYMQEAKRAKVEAAATKK